MPERASRILMEFAAAKQPLRDVGGLKRRALGGRMGCKVARNSDENVPTLIGVAPLAELPHAGFQHLIGMEARVLPEQRVCKRCDEYRGRVAKREMARDQPSGRIDLPLAIECAQQSRTDCLDRVGK